jgi:hypothetical protein
LSFFHALEAIRLPMHVHDVLEQLARRGFKSIPQETVRLILLEGQRQGMTPPGNGGAGAGASRAQEPTGAAETVHGSTKTRTRKARP